MFKKIKEYFKSREEWKAELERKNNQVELMQEHIMEQREEIHKLKRELRISKQMWDISNNQKTY